MANKQFSQEQLLTFMAKLMSLKEKNHYSYRNINLCSKHSLLLKNEVVAGHMTIIADDDYWQLVDQSFISSINYTDWQYQEKAQSPKRALFLKYSYDNYGTKNKYKSMPTVTTQAKIGSNIDDFPYLIEAITRLNNNAEKSEKSSDEIIRETLLELTIESKELESKEKSLIATKDLVKKLNEVKLYRHSYNDN